MQIESGGINNHSAIVTANGALKVHADIESQLSEASSDGRAFCFFSDFISLTTLASGSGILYIKNTNTKSLKISSLVVSGSQPSQWTIYRNPTTGTLITAGVDKVPANLHFGTSLTFAGACKGGADAQTVTNGVVMATLNAGSVLETTFGGAIILSQNSSIAILCKPSAIGTFSCSMNGFFSD